MPWGSLGTEPLEVLLVLLVFAQLRYKSTDTRHLTPLTQGYNHGRRRHTYVAATRDGAGEAGTTGIHSAAAGFRRGGAFILRQRGCASAVCVMRMQRSNMTPRRRRRCRRRRHKLGAWSSQQLQLAPVECQRAGCERTGAAACHMRIDGCGQRARWCRAHPGRRTTGAWLHVVECPHDAPDKFSSQDPDWLHKSLVLRDVAVSADDGAAAC